jgi:hypothetical protein
MGTRYAHRPAGLLRGPPRLRCGRPQPHGRPGSFPERDVLLRAGQGRAGQAARLALVNGVAGAMWATGGQPRVVFGFSITGGKITAIDMLADPERLRQLDLRVLNG